MSINESNDHQREHADGGYGSPSPEEEMPADAATNPGSPDPTLSGQQSDEQALHDDKSLGAPDQNFFEEEDAGSDGEPGAGRLGGTDDQLREELARSEPEESATAADSDMPLDVPSAEAPLDQDDSNPGMSERESFSSESDEDAAGEPM